MQKNRFEEEKIELNTLLSINVRITRLKTSQPRKYLEKKNLDIEEGFKKVFVIKVEKINVQICQLQVRQVNWWKDPI